MDIFLRKAVKKDKDNGRIVIRYLSEYDKLAAELLKIAGNISDESYKRGHGVKIVKLADNSVYIKTYSGAFSRFRVKREFSNMLKLRQHLIPCVTPLGIIEAGRRCSVVTIAVPNARTLKEILIAGRGPEERRALISKLALLISQMCKTGFYHADFHFGNILHDNGQLHLVDVNRLVVSASDRAKRDFLAQFLLAGYTMLTTSELMRVLKVCKQQKDDAAEIHRRFIRRLHEYAADRSERACNEGNSDFARSGGAAASVVSVNSAGKLADNLIARLQTAVPFKTTDSAKCFNAGGLFVKVFASPRKARLYWNNALHAKYMHLPCAEPRFFMKNIAAADFLENTITLTEFVRNEYKALSRPGKNLLLIKFVNWLKLLYLKGVYHKDMKANNVLAGIPDARFYLADCEDIRLKRSGVSSGEIINNLVQLNASLPRELSVTDRLRCLRFLSASRLIPAPRMSRGLIRKIYAQSVSRRHVWP